MKDIRIFGDGKEETESSTPKKNSRPPVQGKLEQFVLTDLFVRAHAGELPRAFGREPEVAAVLAALAKGESVLLLGEAATGKTAILYEAIHWIVEKRAPEALHNLHVVQLSTGTVNTGEWSGNLTRIVKAAREAGDVVLYFDNIWSLAEAGQYTGHEFTAAVDAITDVIMLIKAELTDPGRPLGVLFFSGPTGSGKTFMAKTLARYLFGDEERLVRFEQTSSLLLHTRTTERQMNCTVCSRGVQEDWRYCPGCGTEVRRPELDPSAEALRESSCSICRTHQTRWCRRNRSARCASPSRRRSSAGTHRRSVARTSARRSRTSARGEAGSRARRRPATP